MAEKFDDEGHDSEEIDEVLRGAIEWAHSIQARYAEQQMGSLARKASGDGLGPSRRAEIVELAGRAGFDTEIVRSALQYEEKSKLSEFDEPHVRSLIQSSTDQILAVMEKVGMGTNGRKLLAWSLPSGEVNALCAANTWDDRHYHVFIDGDLVIFCNSIGKLYAECFGTNNVKDYRVDLSSPNILINTRSQRIASRAADLYSATVLQGTPRASVPWLPIPEALQISMLINRGLLNFFVGHELGHLTLRHLEAEETQKIDVSSFQDLTAMVYSQEAEFEADAIGAMLTCETKIAESENDLFTCISAYIFFRSIQTLDSCNDLFNTRSTGLSFTHPRAEQRAEKIKKAISQHLADKKFMRQLPLAFRKVDKISYWLRHSALQNLRDQKAAGATPRARVRLRANERGDPPDVFRLRSTKDTKASEKQIRDIIAKFGAMSYTL